MASLSRVATLYRCKAPTDLVCRCGKVARRLRSMDIEFDEVRVPFMKRDRPEVEVHVEQGSDWRVLRVLHTVEWWRNHAGIESVEMWLGERSCVLGRRALVETWH